MTHRCSGSPNFFESRTSWSFLWSRRSQIDVKKCYIFLQNSKPMINDSKLRTKPQTSKKLLKTGAYFKSRPKDIVAFEEFLGNNFSRWPLSLWLWKIPPSPSFFSLHDSLVSDQLACMPSQRALSGGPSKTLYVGSIQERSKGNSINAISNTVKYWNTEFCFQCRKHNSHCKQYSIS